jgi:2-aminoethylphosphonate-pyruvate transaminase
MLVDYGSRDKLFLSAVAEVRNGLLAAAGASQASGYECVIVQGAGTMGVESVISSVVPKDGKLLILVNGAYGHRIAKMCSYSGIQHEVLEWPDSDAVDVDASMAKLRQDANSGKPTITHVAVIHHETTAGVLNPLERLTKELKTAFPHVCLIVDSMSGFGAYDLQMDWGIDFAVSSANKCIEGVPGFSFALCRRSFLEKSKGVARSLALDLYDQWRNMETTGQFRFTPPTHAILAFRQALAEWNAEGGAQGRLARYRANYEVLEKEMSAMGFKFYVNGPHRSELISTFLMPENPKFQFQCFYDTLAARGYVIYPGKLAAGASFRFGTIGRLFPKDFEQLTAAVRAACADMEVALPLK